MPKCLLKYVMKLVSYADSTAIIYEYSVLCMIPVMQYSGTTCSVHVFGWRFMDSRGSHGAVRYASYELVVESAINKALRTGRDVCHAVCHVMAPAKLLLLLQLQLLLLLFVLLLPPLLLCVRVHSRTRARGC